jgi:hypothetical protein
MGLRPKIPFDRCRFWWVFCAFGMLTACAPIPPSMNAPENYQGPMAEFPTVQPADYWIYEIAGGRTVSSRPEILLKSPDYSFPLWVGKSWFYDVISTRIEGMELTESTPVRLRLDCQVISFSKVTVRAGAFDAFECKCQCRVIGSIRASDRACSAHTTWYAPEVKNAVRIKGDSTDSSWQMVAYKVFPLPERAKTLSRPGFESHKPDWKIGYEWKYAWKGPGTSGTITAEIVRDEPFEGVPSYVLKQAKEEYYYVKDVLGPVATLSGGRVTYKRDAPYQIYSWPMTVGKEWKSSYTGENILEKSSQKYDYRLKVAGLEEVKVPAGIFEAFKIEVYGAYSGSLLDERWYSPQVKHYVKLKRYQRDGIREWDLMSYKAD